MPYSFSSNLAVSEKNSPPLKMNVGFAYMRRMVLILEDWCTENKLDNLSMVQVRNVFKHELNY